MCKGLMDSTSAIRTSVPKILTDKGENYNCSFIFFIVFTLGLSALKLLQDTSTKSKHHGIDSISFKTVDNSVQEFLFKIEEFFHSSGNWTRKKRNEVFEIQLTLNELERVLNEARNEDCLYNENTESSTSSQKSNKTKSGVYPKPEQKKNISPQKKVKFKRASPNSKLLEKIKCTLCDKEYESLKALKLHAKNHHNGEGVDTNAKEIQNQKKVTCMICNTKCQRDLVTRHLVQVHGYEKPRKNAIFRGFFTLNNHSWKPLWLQHDEVEPSEEVCLPVDKEGRVSLYGVVFEADEVNEVKDDLYDNDPQATLEVEEGFEDSVDVGKSRKVPFSEDDVRTASVEGNIKKHIPNKKVMRQQSKPEQEPERPHFLRVLLPSEPSPCDMLKDLMDMYKAPVVRNLEDEFEKETESDKVKGRGIKRKKGNKNELESMDDGCSTVTVDIVNPKVEDGKGWACDDDSDSDFDDNASLTENEDRKHNKEIRKAKRNNAISEVDLLKLEENAGVIKEFERYLYHNKSGSCLDPSKLSTIKKIQGHIYLYHDSYLFFERKKDSKFNLQRLVSPRAQDFAELSDPTSVDGWLTSVSGEDGNEAPGRRREMLKAHIQFRTFLHEKLLKEDFGKDAEDYLRRDMVLRNLQSLKTTIENKRIFQLLSKLEDKGRRNREKARSILFPKSNFNEANCVNLWFESEEAKKEEAECDEIYQSCMAGEKIGDKQFSRVGSWARWTVACEDRNRASVYTFTNLEFMQKKDTWLPEACNANGSTAQERYENLPTGWDADSPPSEGAPPNAWVISVSGSKLKGQDDANLVLTKRGLDACLKFRDMKSECGLKEEHDGQFFVNKQGKALTRLQRTKGSIIDKFGKVTGVHKPTVNTLRRAAESQIQNSSVMKQNVEKIQHHSSAVGLKHYEKSAPNTRASFIAQLSKIESPYKADKEISCEIKKKRIEKEAKDKKVIIEDAKNVLKQQKLLRKGPRTKTNKIRFKERELFQKILSVQVNEKYSGVFPGKLSFHVYILKCNLFYLDEVEFKKLLYRTIDSKLDEDGDKMRDIEMELFTAFAKNEVEATHGPWEGSYENNKLADLCISKIFNTSFKNYEKSREKYEPSYFNF